MENPGSYEAALPRPGEDVIIEGDQAPPLDPFDAYDVNEPAPEPSDNGVKDTDPEQDVDQEPTPGA